MIGLFRFLTSFEMTISYLGLGKGWWRSRQPFPTKNDEKTVILSVAKNLNIITGQ